MEDVLKHFSEELSIVEYDITKVTTEIEALYPDIVFVVQKNDILFDKPYTLFDRPISDLPRETIWKHLPSCLFVSFTSGNIAEKMESVLSIAKNYLSANPSEGTDEISKILNDEKTQGSIQDFMEYCTNTKIAKVFNDILTNLDVSEFEHLLKNPQEFLEIARNPDHPVVQKFIQKFQNILKEKVQKGEISQQQLQQDIEGIKAKLISIFGSSLGEALGGNKSDVSSAVLMSNSPEARRQRMLARLQKKQREKTQR